MTREAMMNDVARRFGYEDRVVIDFCADAETNPNDAEVYHHYIVAMAMPTIDEIDD